MCTLIFPSCIYKNCLLTWTHKYVCHPAYIDPLTPSLPRLLCTPIQRGAVLFSKVPPKHHPKCHLFGLNSSRTLWVATLRDLVFLLPSHAVFSLASTWYTRSILAMLANSIPPGVPHKPDTTSVLLLILELWARVQNWEVDDVRQLLLRLVECYARTDSSLAHQVFPSAVDDSHWLTGVSAGESALQVATRLINTGVLACVSIATHDLIS